MSGSGMRNATRFLRRQIINQRERERDQCKTKDGADDV